MVPKVVHSSKKTGGSDNWTTPLSVFEALNERWKFDIDAAADESNHLCPLWYGPGSELGEDALTETWGPLTYEFAGEQTIRPTHIFLNPPYSRVAEFVKKASEEAALNHATTIMLIPARTDTRWFHQYVYDAWTWKERPHVQICFLKGRLKFGMPVTDTKKKKNNSAPFPSMLVFFHAHVPTLPVR